MPGTSFVALWSRTVAHQGVAPLIRAKQARRWKQPAAGEPPVNFHLNLANNGEPVPGESTHRGLLPPAPERLLQNGVDELAKPQLDGCGRRERSSVVVPVLEAAGEVGKEITRKAVLRYNVRLRSPRPSQSLRFFRARRSKAKQGAQLLNRPCKGNSNYNNRTSFSFTFFNTPGWM